MSIDIIVPVYNCERYLKDCIASVLNQSYVDWKLFLVDDGSIDGSGRICDEYADKDDRINVIHKGNGGVSSARNAGLLASNSEYFCFIDCDDMIYPDAIDIMINDLSSNNADAAFFNMDDLYEKKVISKPKRLKSGTYNFFDVCDVLIDDGNMTGILFGSVCSAIYKRSVIDSANLLFNEKITKNEDGLFNISYIAECSKIYYDGEKHLYQYRHWKTQKSDVNLVYDNVWIETNNAIKDIYKLKNCDNLILNKQMALREISIAFWSILPIINSKKSVSYCSKFIKEVLEDHTKSEGYGYLNRNIDVSKKILIFLMKKKRYLLLSFIIKKVIPLLR